MPSHAELASRLLTDAARFLKAIAEQAPALKPEMDENAATFEQISALIVQDPTGSVVENNGGQTASHAELAGRLLNDDAGFFRNVGVQDQVLRAQMDEKAAVFEEVAALVAQDPTGSVPEGGALSDWAGP